MGFVKEFRDFINRGNVIELAVGIVIGAAFTAIVNSLVADLLTPLLGVLMGGIDFTGLSVQVGNAVFAYGNFIQAIINFLIIAFAVFLLVRAVNMIYRKQPPAPPAPPEEVKLLAEIRDLLKAQLIVKQVVEQEELKNTLSQMPSTVQPPAGSRAD